MKLSKKNAKRIQSLNKDLQKDPKTVNKKIDALLLSKSQSPISPLFSANLYNLKAKANIIIGDNEMAFEALLQTESTIQNSGEKTLLIDINNNKGILNAKIGNYSQAIKCFQFILETIPEDDSEKSSLYLLNLGTLYLNIKNYEKAFNIWKNCLTHFEKNNDHYKLAICHHNFGKAYGEQERFSESLQSFEKAVNHYEKADIPFGKADSLDGLAKTFLSQNDMVNAGNYANEALKIYKQFDSRSGIVKISCILGIIDHKKGNSKKGIQICRKALQEAKKINNETIIRRGLESLYEIYVDLGDYKAALEITHENYAFKEVLLNDHKQSIILQTQKEIDFLREQREIDKKEKEIEHLNRELILQTMETKKRKEFLKMIKLKIFQNLSGSDKLIQSEINAILKEADQILNDENSWDDFKRYFSSIHTEFFGKMYALAPNITSTEARICTYLKLNLSTKEIASLLNLSIRTVENNRLRIRKKLQLKKTDNLSLYLQSL